MHLVKQRLFHVIALVCAVLLAVGMLTFAGPCVHDDGSLAVCYAASRAVLAAGAIAALALVVGLFVPNGKASGALALVAACAGVISALVPGNAMPLCMMHTMRCWTAMQPFALVCGIALAAFAAIAAIRAFRKRPVSYR